LVDRDAARPAPGVAAVVDRVGQLDHGVARRQRARVRRDRTSGRAHRRGRARARRAAHAAPGQAYPRPRRPPTWRTLPALCLQATHVYLATRPDGVSPRRRDSPRRATSSTDHYARRPAHGQVASRTATIVSSGMPATVAIGVNDDDTCAIGP